MLSISSFNIVTGSMAYYGLGVTLSLMKFTAGTYVSSNPINRASFKSINVTLEQINTSTNVRDGAPSLVLDTVGAESSNFGEIVTVTQQIPQ